MLFMAVIVSFSFFFSLNERAKAVALVDNIAAFVVRKAAIKTMSFVVERKAKKTIEESALKEVAPEIAKKYRPYKKFSNSRNLGHSKSKYKIINGEPNDELKRYYAMKSEITSADRTALNEKIGDLISKRVYGKSKFSFYENILDFFTDYKTVVLGATLISTVVTGSTKKEIDSIVNQALLETGLIVETKKVDDGSEEQYVNPGNNDHFSWMSDRNNSNDWDSYYDENADKMPVGQGNSNIFSGRSNSDSGSPDLRYEVTTGMMEDQSANGKNFELTFKKQVYPEDFPVGPPLDFNTTFWGNKTFSFMTYIFSNSMMFGFNQGGINYSGYDLYFDGNYLGNYNSYESSDMLTYNMPIYDVFKRLSSQRWHLPAYDGDDFKAVFSGNGHTVSLYFNYDNFPDMSVTDVDYDVVYSGVPVSNVDTPAVNKTVTVEAYRQASDPKPLNPKTMTTVVDKSDFEDGQLIKLPNLPNVPIKDDKGNDLHVKVEPIPEGSQDGTLGKITIVDGSGQPVSEDTPISVGEPSVDPESSTSSDPVPEDPNTDNPISDPSPGDPDYDPSNPNEDDPGAPDPPGDDDIDWQPLLTTWDELKRVFPFSIPWDVYDIYSQFDVAAKAPKFTVKVDQSFYMGDYYVPFKVDFDIDLSYFDGIAVIGRWGLILVFDVAVFIILRRITPD